VQGMDADEMLHLMKERGVNEDHIILMEHCGINLREWLHGFENTNEAVRETVDAIARHPLMPPTGVNVQGFIMDSVSGELSRV